MLVHALGASSPWNTFPSPGSYSQLVSASNFPPYHITFRPVTHVENVVKSSFPSFVEGTHKPVLIFFYSNWCAHSFHFKNELMELGKKYGDLIRLGAVCNDYQPEVSSMFNVTESPTILFWGIGQKDVMKPEVYNGHQTFSAVWAFFTSHVYKSSSRVEKVQTAQEVRKRVQSSPYSVGAVFFSSRAQPQPLMSIMSIAPNVTHIPFIFVDGEHSEEVGKAFSVPSIPIVAVISTEKDSGKIDVEPYLESEVTYNGLMTFIHDKVESKKKGHSQSSRSAQ